MLALYSYLTATLHTHVRVRDERGLSQSTENVILLVGAVTVAAAVILGYKGAAGSLRILALGLPFMPIGVEEYDLVIPKRFFATDAVQALLEVICSPAFAQTVEGMGGYGTQKTGQIIWEYAGK
mgnify:CR=1 FL=1